MDKVQNFYLKRHVDETGISGTGIVAIGSKLPSGRCVMEWCSYHSSMVFFNNIEDITAIHGHNGSTELIMGDPPKPQKKKKVKNG